MIFTEHLFKLPNARQTREMEKSLQNETNTCVHMVTGEGGQGNLQILAAAGEDICAHGSNNKENIKVDFPACLYCSF